jgi:predicted nucleic acid-binding protein
VTTFALDANIVSYILQKREEVIDRLDAEIAQGNEVVIPPIVYYEIRRGLIYSGATTKADLFNELLSDLEIESIDAATLDVAAAEYARLRKAGTPIEDADLLIGAYCVEKGYTLVTNNDKHLKLVSGLSITNWV